MKIDNKLTTICIFLILFNLLGLLFGMQQAYSLPAYDVVPLVDEGYYPGVHKALDNARESILCVMYMAKIGPKHKGGDEYQLVLDLIAAHKRGVKVTVIFDQNVMFWKKGNDRNKIERKSEYAYELLLKNGVPVFYDSEKKVTHNKILVIDKYITIIGSTNWTYSALRKNHEASVMIKSESVAQAFEEKLGRIERDR